MSIVCPCFVPSWWLSTTTKPPWKCHSSLVLYIYLFQVSLKMLHHHNPPRFSMLLSLSICSNAVQTLFLFSIPLHCSLGILCCGPAAPEKGKEQIAVFSQSVKHALHCPYRHLLCKGLVKKLLVQNNLSVDDIHRPTPLALGRMNGSKSLSLDI